MCVTRYLQQQKAPSILKAHMNLLATKVSGNYVPTALELSPGRQESAHWEGWSFTVKMVYVPISPHDILNIFYLLVSSKAMLTPSVYTQYPWFSEKWKAFCWTGFSTLLSSTAYDCNSRATQAHSEDGKVTLDGGNGRRLPRIWVCRGRNLSISKNEAVWALARSTRDASATFNK